MSQQKQKDLTFDIDKLKDFPAWYEEIVALASLVDKRTNIKGCTVMPAYGCFIHSAIMHFVEDEWIKQGIPLAQFPTLIPETTLCKEKEHLEGFAPEVFWVTEGGTSKLTPRLALRPTSETIMYSTFASWIQSYRDLPVCVQQSCQVFRCETKDTTPLIRAREIYWNEAHCCHATAEESEAQCVNYWKAYRNLFDNVMRVPGLYIRRPPWDTFPGAVYTDVIDVIMPSGRVLQSASAHFLGTSFSRMYDVRFYGKEGESQQQIDMERKKREKQLKLEQKKTEKEAKKAKKAAEAAASSASAEAEAKAEAETKEAPKTEEAETAVDPATGEPADGSHYAYMSCAGISTRAMASVISIHGDNKGLVLPTDLAPYQVVIIPIMKGKAEADQPVLDFVKKVSATLLEAGIRNKVDDGPGKPGPKFFYWEMKGVPCRLEVGPRDVEEGSVFCAFRNQDKTGKHSIKVDNLVPQLRAEFAEYNKQLFDKAVEWHTKHLELFPEVADGTKQLTLAELKTLVDKNDMSKPCVFRIPFVDLHDPQAKELDAKLREETGLEVRGYSITDPAPKEGTKCTVSGRDAKCFVYIARAY